MNKIRRTRDSREAANEASISVDEQVQAFTFFLSKVASSFDKITATRCSCHIMLAVDVEDRREPYLVKLCRDRNVSGRVWEDKKKKIDIKHSTAYRHVFDNFQTPKGRYYFVNDLPNEKGYQNPLFELYGNFSYRGLPDDRTEEERERIWDLPFRGIIVVPITPLGEIEEGVERLIGYLTLETEDTDVLVENIDTRLMMNIADELYDPLRLFAEDATAKQLEKKKTA